MDFTANYDMFLNEEHDLLRQTVREFAEREVAPNIRAWDRSGAEHGEGPETRTHIRPLIEKMGKLGFLGICFPAKYGGAGMDYLPSPCSVKNSNAWIRSCAWWPACTSASTR